MFTCGVSHRTALRVIGVLPVLSFLLLTGQAFAVVAGDIDNSGIVNAADVQLVINGALGRPVAYATDIDHDAARATNAVDVQLVIMAVLRLTIDKDGDGLCDAAEGNLHTDPQHSDTDMDGVPDCQEVLDGTDPLTPNLGTPPFSLSVLFDNHNDDAAAADTPTAPTEVHLEAGAFVALMSTWHPNGIQVDTLSIRAQDGTVFGPWQTVSVSNNGAAVQWQVTPNIPLPPGVYTVVDAAPGSWFHNTASGNAGFARLEGVAFSPAGSGTIGSAGGELVANGLRVTIPPGAFASDATLSLSNSDITKEGVSSGGFMLSGLPEGYGSFSVEMPAPGEPDGDMDVFVGTQGYQLSQRITTVDRTPLPATVAGGTLHFTIPPVSPSPTKNVGEKASGPTFIYRWTRCFGDDKVVALLTANGHFRLNASNETLMNNRYSMYIYELAESLETAYDVLEKQLDLQFVKRTQWPMAVDLEWPWFSDAHGYASRSNWGRNYDYMTFNLYSVTDPALRVAMRAIAIHELFHILQYNYVEPATGAGAVTEYGAGDRNWLMEASSTWSEWLVCGNSYYPDVVQGNEGLFPLNGLLDAYTTEARDGAQARNPDYHGYSASLFLRYLWEAHSPLIIGRLWEHLGEGVPVTNAFDLACPAWKTDWRSYCRAAYGGELQRWRVGDGVIEMRTQSISQTVRSARPSTCATVKDDSGLRRIRYATGPLPPVSATLFQIDVSYRPTNPEDNIIYFEPYGLNADTTVQIRWCNPKPRSLAEWTSSVLGEVTAGAGLTVDLNTIDDLPTPFVFQVIATNSNAATACPNGGIQWSMGSMLGALQATTRCQGGVTWEDMNGVRRDILLGGGNPLKWEGRAFSYESVVHEEWTTDLGAQMKRDDIHHVSGTIAASGMWLEDFSMIQSETIVASREDPVDHMTHVSTQEQGGSFSWSRLPYSSGLTYSVSGDAAARSCAPKFDRWLIYKNDGVLLEHMSYRYGSNDAKTILSVEMGFYK